MKIFAILFFTVALILAGAPDAHAGFGISPPWFKNNHLSPGAHYEQDIFLVQGRPEVDVKVTATIESAEQIESWMTFKPGKEFIIPAGTQQFPVRVTVDVPPDAGYTTYTGKIRFVTTAVGASGNGNVAIQLGALADISLTVTSDEVSDFKVQGVAIDDIEEGWPITASIRLENLGNVKVRPTKVRLVIYDKWHDKIVQEGEAQAPQWIDPFSVGVVTATMDTELPLGDYFADFEVFKGEEVVAKDKERFNILEKGTLKSWPKFFGVSVAWWGGGLGGLMGLILFVRFNVPGRILGAIGIEIQRKKKPAKSRASAKNLSPAPKDEEEVIDSPAVSMEALPQLAKAEIYPSVVSTEPSIPTTSPPEVVLASTTASRIKMSRKPRVPRKPKDQDISQPPKKRGRPRKIKPVEE